MALIKVRDRYGNFYDIPALQGQNGTCIYCGEVDENSIYTVQLPAGFVAKKGDLILANNGRIWRIIDVTNQRAEETGITLQGPQGEQGPQGDQGEPGRGIEYVDVQYGILCVKYTDSDALIPLGPVVESATNKQELDFFPLDDEKYGVAAGNSGYLSKIEIPETYNGKNVTLITTKGFYDPYSESYGSERIKEIVVPETVTNIETYAFHSDRVWVLIRLKHEKDIPLINSDSFDIWQPEDSSNPNRLSHLVIAVTNKELYPEDTETTFSDWDVLRDYMVSGVDDKNFSTFSFGEVIGGDDILETTYLPFFEGQTWEDWCDTTLNRRDFNIVEVEPGASHVLYGERDIFAQTSEGSWRLIKPTELIDKNTKYGVYYNEE